MAELLHNEMFWAPFLGWVSAQILKTIIHFIVYKKFKSERLIGSGGMPSSHSATVCALMTATAYHYGFSGFEFPMACTFGMIVMYDAINVRQETGKQSIILNLFLNSEEIKKHLQESSKEKWTEIILKEYVGHTPLQVLCGMALGIVIGLLVCL